MAHSVDEALTLAERIGYPVIVRPSFVIGGLAIDFCYSPEDLERQLGLATIVDPDRPVRIDRYLEGIEVDVDAVSDGEAVLIPGLLEHVERAGVHSGDSVGVFPPQTVGEGDQDLIVATMERIVLALGAKGLVNAQFIVREDGVYLIEVNPRASRTVPFASKAIGVNLVHAACRLAAGTRLSTLRVLESRGQTPGQISVKAAVFPFQRFPGSDPVLGPEMRSTGEVMGGATTFGSAFAKAQLGAGVKLPSSGAVFISVSNHDKPAVVQIARDLQGLGFSLVATRGTANFLRAHGIDAEIVFKVNEGRPHVGDEILNNRIQLVINTPLGRESFFDDKFVRRTAMMQQVPCITTLTGAAAAVYAIRALNTEGLTVRSLQEYHAEATVTPKT